MKKYVMQLMGALMVALMGMGIGGCIDLKWGGGEAEAEAVKKIPKTAYVVLVGVGNGFAGKCSGTDNSVKQMTAVMKNHAAKIVTLKNEKATKAAVRSAMEAGVKSDFFIFYFSGHGTHTYATTDKGEVDGQDEYICCYDNVLSDNEVWETISKSKGRVMLIFDSCHSGTMYREGENGIITLAGARARAEKNQAQKTKRGKKGGNARATTTVSGPISMLCWSGCPDDKYSWGNVSGGFMTQALKKNYKKTLTYDQLWAKMEKDKKTKQYQVIQQTKMGKDFGKSKVFQ